MKTCEIPFDVCKIHVEFSRPPSTPIKIFSPNQELQDLINEFVSHLFVCTLQLLLTKDMNYLKLFPQWALLTGNGSASNCAFFYKTRRIRNTWCTVYRKRKCTESNLSLHLGLIIIIVPSEMISPNFELQNLINEFVSLNSCSF